MHFFFEKKEKLEKEKAKKDLIEGIILENYNQYYRLAYSYVHNEADASDIVQNGAYKALRSSHTLNQPEYAETWLYRIMLNECFQHFKHPQFLSYETIPERNRIDGTDEINKLDRMDGINEIKGMETDVIEARAQTIDLQRALKALSDKDRAVVILKYFEDKKLEEIAEILEENVNTIKSRLYRSIKKLRNILSEESEEIRENEYHLKRKKGG